MDELINQFPMVFYRIGIRYFIAAGVAFFIYYILFKNRLTFKKIQGKFPKVSDYQRDFIYSATTVAIFALIAIGSFTYLRPYNVVIYDISARPLWYWILTVIPIFIIHDFYFYWAHRLMHHPSLFKHIHKVHHLSTNPSPWTAYAFHPIEAVIETLIIPILVFTVPTHPFVIVLFMIFQIIYNVYGHLGYELFPKGFHKTWIGRYINTSVAHNQHHQWFHGNYGLYTLIWDRMFGTLRSDYDQSYENATQRKKAAEAT
ncbi:MAG: sterol desaturase family protein [Marinoscillum sp.]